MKTFSRLLLIVFSLAIITCTGGGGGGGTDMAEITIDLGQRSNSQSGFTSMLSPDDIRFVRIVISGEGINPDIIIEQDVTGVDGSVITVSVPVGQARRFQAFAYDAEHGLLYSGETTVAVSGSTRTVVIVLTSEGFCEFNEVTYVWDGVDTPETDCASSSGGSYNTVCSEDDYDDNLYYNLPWSFPFYGTVYDRISFDTNGNIWLGGENSYDDSFDLPTAGDEGPVIAAFNEYLSSYDYGEMRLQHKSNPDRVVIEWETETYDDYIWGNCDGPCLNLFSITLYPNGDIRLDYDSFNYDNMPTDYGSGISNGDGENYISVTDQFGDVYTYSERSLYYRACLPYISNMLPENGELDQAFNTNVRMTLHSPLGIDFTTFVINLSNSNGLTATIDTGGYDETYTDSDIDVVSKTGTADEYDVTVNPDIDFPESETIWSIVNVDDVAGHSLIPPDWSFEIESERGYYYPPPRD